MPNRLQFLLGESAGAKTAPTQVFGRHSDVFKLQISERFTYYGNKAILVIFLTVRRQHVAGVVIELGAVRSKA